MKPFYVSKVLQSCSNIADDPMFIFENIETGTQEILTGTILSENIKKIGSCIQNANNPSEKVLVLLPQGLEFIYSIIGCWYANVVAVITPVTSSYLTEMDIKKIKLIVNKSKPKSIISSSEIFQNLQSNSILNDAQFIDIEEIKCSNYEILPPRKQISKDLALLTYTSGSTSQPKGVALTHDNIIQQAEARQWRIDKNTRMVSWLPQFHAFGINNNILTPALFGGLSVLFSPESFIRDPKQWFKLINKYKATHTACLNFSFDYCYKNINEDEISGLSLESLEAIICAGEPIRKKSYLNFFHKFKKNGLSEHTICPLYGLSEVCPITSNIPGKQVNFLNLDIESLKENNVEIIPNDKSGKIVVSCGEIEEGVTVAIIDKKTKQTCFPNEIGEIWISSERVANGYYNDQEQIVNISKIISEYKKNIEFFNTEDLGFIRDNELYIVGREKEMMVISGKNYHPIDLEWTIQNEVSSVSSVAVFSTDIADQERVIAVVEIEDRNNIQQINKIIKTVISKDFGLKLYDLLIVGKGIIPKTGSGKVQRSLCKKKYIDKELLINRYGGGDIRNRVGKNEFKSIKDITEKIITEIRNLGPEINELSDSNSIEDYGLNSIQYMQVSSALEKRFNVKINTVDLFKYPTFKALGQYIQEQLNKGQVNSSKKESESENFQEENDDNLIAIVGMDFSFPGHADTKEKFWENLLSGVDTVSAIDSKRESIIRDFKNTYGEDRGMFSQWGSFIDEVEQFDADFFKISPVEAECMDPQQRKALQMTWKTIEDAGYNPSNLSGNKVGVFIGVHNYDYEEILLKNISSYKSYGAYTDSGTHPSLITNRVSRWFNFKGPSETVNTACSSSLVSIHRAVQSIKNKECTMAIAGGINLILSSKVYLACEKAGMLSQDGKCKTFDETANGFVRAEGYGAVMLKPYKQALLDNDNIYGLVRGSNVNHDGKTSSLRAPSIEAQTELIKEAYLSSGTPTETVNYIEMHGTGTKLGDPIELEALKNVFGSTNGNVGNKIALGSLKTNVGHMESAAGIGGLIKVLLSMKHRVLPKILHFNTLNPNIQLDDTAFYIVDQHQQWEQVTLNKGKLIPRRAGISSFGFGGSNAHIIVEEHIDRKSSLQITEKGKETSELIFPISADNRESLNQMVNKIYEYINSVDYDSHFSIKSLSYTLQVGRKSMEERVVFLASNLTDLKSKLYNYVNNVPFFNDYYSGFARGNYPEVIKISNLDNNQIAKSWSDGKTVDWDSLYQTNRPKRLHLPTYQFSMDRYWLPDIQEHHIDRQNNNIREEKNIEGELEVKDDQIRTKTLHANAIQYLKEIFSEMSRVSIKKLDAQTDLVNYGIDSIIIKQMTEKMNKTFAGLPVSIFFEYRTLSDLANYLVDSYAPILKEIYKIEDKEATTNIKKDQNYQNSKKSVVKETIRVNQSINDDIAIVGVSGKYPDAKNLNQFWDNLLQARNSVREIPIDRWNVNQYYNANEYKVGDVISKWGGYIDNPLVFDPLFFNITPDEAYNMEPEERLFLQSVYETIEDAGYTRKDYENSSVGVYVGSTFLDAPLVGVDTQIKKASNVSFSGSASSIANRVSYYFNFTGPSLTIDTMCSSSLTALHLACQSIKIGDCKAAIVGGINLNFHPNKYLYLSKYNFLSSEGKCKAFGNEGDGYVPGEGVGSILVKPLSDAVRDGDNVYGVIKSTAINHGGRTNGYFVPNPVAQSQVIEKAISLSGISPEAIGYIEAHGTGTSLGDPIELSGLTKAFQRYTDKNGYCSIGSVKTNIGHLEAAAGIAGLTKILLQLKHKKLVPSLYSDPVNPNINFKESPFYIQRQVDEWARKIGDDGKELPLSAAISSFGAGGSNAHVILQEYIDGTEREVHSKEENTIIVLSAKTEEQLRTKASQLVSMLKRDEGKNLKLSDISYTLQVGREQMDYRLAIATHNRETLIEELNNYVSQRKNNSSLFVGNMENVKNSLNLLELDTEWQEILGKWFAERKYSSIMKLWVSGVDIDWEELNGYNHRKRVSLPTYPFEQEYFSLSQTFSTEDKVELDNLSRSFFTPKWVKKELRTTGRTQ